MNCPSRTEESPLHPEWNQNPPFLPADLTTRQDLNGIVNSRRCRVDGDPLATDCCRVLDDRIVESDSEIPSPSPTPRIADAKLPLSYRDEVCAANPRVSTIHRTVTSLIGDVYPLLSRCQRWFWPGATLLFLEAALYYVGRLGLSHDNGSSLSRARAKRTSTCDTSGTDESKYNTPLHVGALMIILFVSSTACAFPMLAVRFPRLHMPANFLFVVRHFGTGVLIATAFVHLLPTAFTSLGDPCLSDFWTTDYPAMPGAIALTAVFLVTVVEMVFSPGRSMCGNVADVQRTVSSPSTRTDPVRGSTDAVELPTRSKNNANSGNNNYKKTKTEDRPDTLCRAPSRRGHDPLCGRTTSIGRGLAQMNVDAARYDDIEHPLQEPGVQEHYSKEDAQTGSSQTTGDMSSSTLTPEQKRKKAVMQCMLLEMGILFHSVFIGMALSVTVGNAFVILLVAITFHQSFEGLALGSRIASLSWDPKALQPWFMALAYGCTTPLGQAIGLATHTLYSPDSEVGLIMVGVMNAISAGLLLYASLIELLSEDFLSDESWRLLQGKRRVFACVLVFMGAVGMSLIGAWA